ncbi:SLBB domain-containing protein [Desulfobotulus sp. H1]|uniref:SLBB domain-containing protein n=1 Tax=Desulfobotulus pelophilus TaxID=2823377 RepID=A0ABT3NC90_9BACT|nr:SLBB domain-containing protein [Desulfobotulus pelophilus]MCW7755073.1 SLBB domain-containing protein [Desulfobotulus pelophilus]
MYVRWNVVVFCVLLWCLGFSVPAPADDYTVGPGDTLDIRVYNHADLSVKASVSGEGTIRYPLLGEFRISGKTPSEISVLIENMLADGYILNPQVSVFLNEYRSRKVTILGEVDKPGLYELAGRIYLLELISRAGGLTLDAGRSVYVTRSNGTTENGDAGQEVLHVDLHQLIEQGDVGQNILIRNGDSVFIPKVEKIYVTGEVRRPAAYSYDADLTLIKVLTNAGGLTDKASSRNIRIIRDVNGEKVVLQRVSMDQRVQPNDVIVVPESFF